ncbi:MAG: PilZ domain-containing protein [Candidatus Omnitrophota bacterium]
MAEKRRYVRQDLKYKVTYSISDNPMNEYRTKSFNISLSGIGIQVSEFIMGDRYMHLKIHSPKMEKPIVAKGRIAWQGFGSDPGEKKVGIQFTNVPISELTELLENASNN